MRNYKIWGWIAISLWVALYIREPNFGFYPMENAEMIGSNIGHLILPIIGIALIVSDKKKPKKEDELE